MIDNKELRLNIIMTLVIMTFSCFVGYILYNSSLNPDHYVVKGEVEKVKNKVVEKIEVKKEIDIEIVVEGSNV